jgi:hypothetical protein
MKPAKMTFIVLLLMWIGSYSTAQNQSGTTTPASPATPTTPITPVTPAAPPPGAPPTVTPTRPFVPAPSIIPSQPSVNFPPPPTNVPFTPMTNLAPRLRPNFPFRTNFPPGRPGPGDRANGRTNFPPALLNANPLGGTNQRFLTMTADQRVNLNRLIGAFNALRTGPGGFAVREQFASGLMEAAASDVRPSSQTVSRLVNDLALATSTLTLPGPQQFRLIRNLNLLMNASQLNESQSQFLLGDTIAVLQSAGIHPSDVQLITTDLNALVAELQQASANRTQPAQGGAPGAVSNPSTVNPEQNDQ